jgi:dihydrolipoamide dehydrogenase
VNDSFDLVIIGAGPGGYKAAARAAQLGMRVACVDKSELGGTCLNVGCIPSKALLESSELYHRTGAGLEKHGIQVGEVGLDLGAMMGRKDKVVDTMVKGIGGLFRMHKVEHVAGAARITAPGSVEVTGEEGVRSLQAERILIATGSAPVELKSLPFDGRYILSSTEALALSAVPERMVVIGAGAIGLEMGSVWSRLGTEVLVVEYMDHILPGMDREMTTQLQRLLKRQGLGFELGASAQSATVEGGRVQLKIAVGDEERVEACDCILVAVGRRPYIEGLGGEELGLELDERGHVKVDGDFHTSVKGIYAIGDAIPGPMLAHKAEEEGVAAVERMAGMAGQVNYHAIPNVVYTHPELAAVGLSEEVAGEQGRKIKVGKYQFRANARAHSMDAIDGLVKILSDARSDRLLGMHILGPQASHLIAEGAVAMEFAASAEDLARSVHAHPTLSEVIKEAAWAVEE